MSRDASKEKRGSAGRALVNSSKFSRRAEKLHKWDAFKDEVYRLYIKEDNTLQLTMSTIEEQYSFKASLRKWKLKLKEWGFEKYLSRSDMAAIAAKANKRYTEERKETVFYHGETRISKERLDNFKRRKIFEYDYVLCDADTPPHISYSTPEPEICNSDAPPHMSDPIAEPDMSVILRSKRCELMPFAPPYKTRVKIAIMLSANGLLYFAILLFLYMVSNMERIIFCRSNPRKFISGRVIEARTAVDEIMRPERNEFQLALPNLIKTIENKVQEWLGLEVPSLEVPNSSLLGRSDIRSENQESDMEGTPSVMETSADEEQNLGVMEVQTSVMMSFDEPDRRGALSIMEVDDEEMDECLSITTDLGSSNYGFTYTESEMSGISYNYTALFPV